MADTVRYHMEEMVPELEDLEKRGFFSAAELKQIAAKRTDFEYLLKRRAPLKADYLRYVDFEKKVEALRVVRKKSRRLHGKPSLADRAGPRRIHFIFERATRKFAGDLALWSRWLAFCREAGSTRRTSRVLTKALQLHPTAAGLWSAAAAWELQQNGNAAAARALMQRGLRLAADSPHLWLEYFRLELTYASRLAARRRVLGVDQAGAAPSAEAAAQDSATAAEGAEAAAEPADESDAALQAVLGGGVARIVFRNAIAARPDDLDLRRRFLAALTPFQLSGVPAIESEIYDSIARDFADRPEAVDLAARRHLTAELTVEQLQGATDTYQQALRAQPSTDLFDKYIDFLTQQLEACQQLAPQEAADVGVTLPSLIDATAAAGRLLAAFEQAATAGCASEAALLSWPAVALRCGRPEAALAAAQRAAAAMPRSPPVQRQALVLQAQHCTLQVATATSEDVEAAALRRLEAAALAAATAVGAAPDAALVWLAALEALAAAGAPLDRLLDRLVAACLGQGKGPVRGGIGTAAAAAVEAVHAVSGVAAARTLWRRLAAGPLPGGELFLAAAHAEAAAVAAAEADADVAAVRAAFEAGVAGYGAEDWQLWVEFVQFAQHGAGKGLPSSGDLIQRARRALRDFSAFSAALKDASA